MSTKTITLAGSEIKAEFSGANAWLRNDSADVIYAAANPGITAGADGVVSILAGQSAPVYGANGAVWLLGTGSVQLIGSDYSTNPFKTSAQAGGSGADEVARAAINAHSGNAEIHVTAAEKTAWNGKAELTDIPDKLPADGGNADTVDGKHAEDFAAASSPTIDGIITLTRSGVTVQSQIFEYANSLRFRTTDPNATNKTYRDVFITPTGVYTEGYVDGSNIGRTNINDGGNAASVGVYTEAKLAALEARVAALEGK